MRSSTPSPTYEPQSPTLVTYGSPTPDFHGSPLHCLDCFLQYRNDEQTYGTEEYRSRSILSQPVLQPLDDLQDTTFDDRQNTFDLQNASNPPVATGTSGSSRSSRPSRPSVTSASSGSTVQAGRSSPPIVISDTPPSPIDLPPYSPTRAWLYEPIVGLDSDIEL